LKSKNILIAEKYRLKDKIAESDISEIWLAEEVNTQQVVVVKKILEEKRSKNIENLLLFNKEASILKQLRHAYIVEIYDFGESDGSNYIVMEYVEGQDLGAFLKERGHLDVVTFLKIAIPLSETLAFIHNKNVIHGDIKPGNIIITGKNQQKISIKLLDFGVALLKDLGSVYQSHLSGTFAYMSPEQSGILKRPIDLHSDLYSLGVLFYQMLSGELPYQHNDIYSLIHMHIASEPYPLSKYNIEVPEILESVIEKLLRKEIADRYSSTEILVRDLKNIQEGISGEPKRLNFIPGSSNKPEISKEHVSFVGRLYELAYLKSLDDETKKGKGKIVFVSGEPGVGKTRLLEELKEYALKTGGICVSTEFEEMENPLPYSGFTRCVNHFLDIIEMFSKDKYLAITDSIKQVLGKLSALFVYSIPKLNDLFPDSVPVKQLEGDKEKIRFDNVFIKLLGSMGKHLPVVVFFIDNIQWADNETLVLIRKLSKAKDLHNILYIIAAREDKQGGEGISTVSLDGEKNIHHLKIKNFSKNEVTQIVFRILGDESKELKKLAEIIFQKTAGNAFFVKEFVHMLLRERLVQYEDGWEINYSAINILPYTRNMAELIINTANQLSEAERDVLAMAAVYGKEFEFSHLVLCFDELENDTIFQALENAKAHNIVIQGGTSNYFSHDIVHEVFYDKIPIKTRKKYHERIAHYLENVDKNSVYKILHHYQHSNNISKKIEYLVKAGGFAQSRNSHQDAVRFFSTALTAIKKSKNRDHVDLGVLHEKLGESLKHIGNYRESKKHFEKALTFIREIEDKVELYKKMSYSMVAEGHYEQAIDMLKNSLLLLHERVPESKPTLGFKLLREILTQFIHALFPYVFRKQTIAKKENRKYKKQILFQMIGWVCLWAIKRELLIYSHFKALNLCDRAGISEEGIELLLTHCAVLGSIGGPPVMVKKVYKRIRRFLRRTNHYIKALHNPALLKALYLAVYGSVELDTSAYGKAVAALRILQEQHTVTYLQEISNCCAQIFEFHGKFNMLVELAEEVRFKGTIFNNRLLISLGDLYAGIAAYHLGRTDESINLLETALAEFVRVSDKVNCQYTYLFLVKAYSRKGYFYKAEEYFNSSLAIITKEHQAHGMVISRIFPFFLEALLDKFIKYAETEAERQRRLRLAVKYFKKSKILSQTYDCHKGMFYRLAAQHAWIIENKRKKAERIFEQGRAYFANSPEAYNKALFFYCYGEFLSVTDPRRAIETLEHTYLDFDNCGAAYEMHRIERLLQELMEQRASVHAESTETPRAVVHSKTGSFTINRELDTVIDIGKKINIIHDIDLLMEEILNHAIQLVGAEQGELFLYEGDELVSKYHVVIEGAEERPASMGVVSKVDYSGAPLVISDAGNDPIFRSDPQVTQYGLKSIVCVPLLSRDKKIGLLYLSNHLVGGLFTEHELDLLNAMAGQAAIALENSLLFRETKKLQIYLNSIIDSMPVALIALDPSGSITYINTAAKMSFPELSKATSEKNLWQTAPILRKYKNAFEQVISEQRLVEYQKELLKKQYWSVTIFPLVYEEITGAVVKLNNITEQEKIQQHLIQAQKMEAVGTLVGGLAHDFNNILGGILATISFLNHSVLPSKETFSRSDFEEEFKMITDLVERASNLVQQLLTISMRKDVRSVSVDLNDAVNHVINICRKSFDKGIEFDVSLHPEAAPILADPAQLEQVILNLCINASHAMTIMRPRNQKWEGTLKIGIKKVTPYKSIGNGIEDAARGEYWCLSIEDTGVGMDENTVKKVFEPFFTTKDTGKGSGLGLAMVYSIIRRFNGHINVYSEPGQGSIFHIYLPVQHIIKLEKVKEKTKTKVHHGHGTALVIEDEEVIRKSVERILKSVGYKVLSAESGAQGIEHFRSHQKEISVVLLDMVMPKESGKQVFMEMRRVNPEVKVILMSGFRKDQRVQEVMAMGVKNFLQKPFSQDELLSAVEEVLRE
jgi:serine/threonine protein kinase/signal transduction histidine kinase/CheY-like chemotaxis protein/tetratricopeptide (TPR) repeat protein